MSDAWDVTTPVGTEAISNGDDRIREMKRMIQIALRGNTTEGLEAMFPGADTANPVFRYRGLKDVTGSRPSAGQYGLFFDSTRNVLQRDNGASWDDVGTVIPSGTVMVFYQAAAPTGFAAVAVNDKFLRVVSAGGTGGSTNGSTAASVAHSHVHDLGSHTHTTPNHQHTLGDSGAGSFTASGGTNIVVDGSGNIVTSGGAGVSHSTSRTTSAGEGNSTTGASSGNTLGTSIAAYAFADVIIASKS